MTKNQERLNKPTKTAPEALRGTREALLNILEDIEEARKTAEEERDKTLAIIENFPEGLLFFDKENKLSSINPRACRIFKVKSMELMGKKINDLLKIPSLAALLNILGEEIKGIFRKELKLKGGLVLEVSSIEVVRDRKSVV